MNNNVIDLSDPASHRAEVDKALRLLEHADITAANTVRAYILRLERALAVHEAGADPEPGNVTHSWRYGEGD